MSLFQRCVDPEEPGALPSMMFLDINMGRGMTGVTVMKRFRELAGQDGHLPFPVVAVTGDLDDSSLRLYK